MESATSLFSPKQWIATHCVRHFLYSFGGSDLNTKTLTGAVSRLSLIDRKEWQRRSPMSHPGYNQGSLRHKGKFYIFGGYQRVADIDVNQVHNSV